MNEPILKQIDDKLPNKLRVLTFNINGINTLFNYYPWNKFNQDLNQVFLSLNVDIVSLQELKLTTSTLSTSCKYLGHLANYKSFISLPKFRKGYSGVGVFVRIPHKDESPQIKSLLSVVKVEDGLTGWLTCPQSGTCYRDSPAGIGGYTNIDETDGLLLDEEGRCVIVELANKTVVISVYCPANSMQTEQGELFRQKFLLHLFQRSKNLHDLGKKVILMGDINVSLDLIDNYEEIQTRLQARLITSGLDNNFEIINYEECIRFKSSTKPRKLLNDVVVPQIHSPQDLNLEPLASQFLYDTTRQIQGRKLNMFTVWNTMKDLRTSNIGSRIDLILVTKNISAKVTKANIWPYLLGSDHCPVFTDFEVEDVIAPSITTTKLLFEAKYYYKLIKDKDVMGMFSALQKSKSSTKNDTIKVEELPEIKLSKAITNPQDKVTKPKLVYKSRKVKKVDLSGQQSINNFFKN